MAKENGKVAIVLPDLRGGGAEKVCIILSKEFIKEGYNIEFVLFNKRGVLLSEVPEGVNIIDLKSNSLSSGFIPLIRYFRQRKPDGILAIMWPITIISIWARIFSGSKAALIACEHTTFSMDPIFKRPINRFLLPFSMWLSYPLADKVLSVSRGVENDLKKLSKSKRANFNTVYNPACPDISYINTVEPDNSFWKFNRSKRIIAIGNLKEAKDYPTLIKAFRLVSQKTNAELLIIGEGEERVEIEQLCNYYNIQEKIHLPGFINNPFPCLKSADLFVLSSAWEGLPTVLIEALACGIPVVSTNCKSGPDEILDDGKYGTLVPVGDSDALAKAIIDNLQAEHNPTPLIERAQFFSPDRISDQYLKLLFPE